MKLFASLGCLLLATSAVAAARTVDYEIDSVAVLELAHAGSDRCGEHADRKSWQHFGGYLAETLG